MRAEVRLTLATPPTMQAMRRRLILKHLTRGDEVLVRLMLTARQVRTARNIEDALTVLQAFLDDERLARYVIEPPHSNVRSVRALLAPHDPGEATGAPVRVSPRPPVLSAGAALALPTSEPHDAPGGTYGGLAQSHRRGG